MNFDQIKEVAEQTIPKKYLGVFLEKLQEVLKESRSSKSSRPQPNDIVKISPTGAKDSHRIFTSADSAKGDPVAE